MDGDKKYHLKETYRLLELALIGIKEKNRKLIQDAIEHLNKYVESKK